MEAGVMPEVFAAAAAVWVSDSAAMGVEAGDADADAVAVKGGEVWRVLFVVTTLDGVCGRV